MVNIQKKFNGESAWAYAIFYDSVQLGYWNGTELRFHYATLNEGNVQELRVFNADKELRYVRLPDGSLAERFIDDTGKAPDVSDLYYAVYGETNVREGDWTLRMEARGGQLAIPAVLDEDNTDLFLKIRNYFQWEGVPVGKKEEYEDNSDIKPNTGALSFQDYRFVGFFTDSEGKTEVKTNVRV
jgi:CRISPR-associated protein (TIGR03984 family)